MQGLEFVDVPGLVIFATGAGIMGAMLLASIGSRSRDKAAVERLHAVQEQKCADVVACPIDIDLESDDCADASGTRELLDPEYDDEITVPVLYTSADMARCREGATVRPIRRSAS